MTRVADKNEFLARIAERVQDLADLGVCRLGLFGSFAREAPRTDSDVDLLVDFAPGRKSFDSFMQVAFLLEEILQRRVELVTRESLSPTWAPGS